MTPDGKLMHRIVMGVTDPKIFVDHINGNTLDNRKENLRLCNNTENCRNSKKSVNNTSGYKGVSYVPWSGKWLRNKPWRAYIVVDRKQISLGMYKTKEEAHEAYKQAAVKYHGEFANFG
jgi:hypothetical protein